MTPDEKAQLNRLQDELNALKNAMTIPFEIHKALSSRLALTGFAKVAPSSKTVASESQTVNEGGTSTYSVAKPYDTILEFQIGSTTYYIGVYTSTT